MIRTNAKRNREQLSNLIERYWIWNDFTEILSDGLTLFNGQACPLKPSSLLCLLVVFRFDSLGNVWGEKVFNKVTLLKFPNFDANSMSILVWWPYLIMPGTAQIGLLRHLIREDLANQVLLIALIHLRCNIWFRNIWTKMIRSTWVEPAQFIRLIRIVLFDSYPWYDEWTTRVWWLL